MHKKYRNTADIRTVLSLQTRVKSTGSAIPSCSPVASHAANNDRASLPWFVVLKSRMGEAISFLINAVRSFPSNFPNAARDELRTLMRDLQNSVTNDLAHLRDDMNGLHIELNEARSYGVEMLQYLQRIEQYSYAIAGRVAINCGSDAVMIRTASGYVLCPSGDYPLVSCLVDTGDLERGTRLLIEKLVRPGHVFVDVGANIGLHTLAAARAMNGKGRIVAFEPFRPTAQLLRKSVWMNGFSEIVEVHQAAASDHSGHQRLFLGQTCGHHSLFELKRPADADPPAVEVALVTLDEVMSHAKVNLIKIDVEGAELEVVNGGKNAIDQSPDIALIVEFGPSHLKRTNHSTVDWLSRFEAFGMICRAINADTGSLEEWSIQQLEAVESINLLFARPSAAIWRKLEKQA